MTDEQINAAIHAALKNPIGCPRCHDPECVYNRGLNYCNDLNAMQEAITLLDSDQFADFIWALMSLSHEPMLSTARQRAEAFLRTIGKWEEVQA